MPRIALVRDGTAAFFDWWHAVDPAAKPLPGCIVVDSLGTYCDIAGRHRNSNSSVASLLGGISSVEPAAYGAWLGYNLVQTTIKGTGRAVHELMPRVHRVAALLKRWLLDTQQGGVHNTHLDYYLDEFTFRFNRPRSRTRGILFFRLMQQAAACTPVPYRALVGEPPAERSTSTTTCSTRWSQVRTHLF